LGSLLTKGLGLAENVWQPNRPSTVLEQFVSDAVVFDSASLRFSSYSSRVDVRFSLEDDPSFAARNSLALPVRVGRVLSVRVMLVGECRLPTYSSSSLRGLAHARK
jgi:hypothetical protein